MKMLYIPELAIRTKLKLEKLMTKFSLVADIITQIEIVAHFTVSEKNTLIDNVIVYAL